jgi:phage terminase small subunit
LKDPEVRSAIQKKLEKYDITPERVLAEIAKLGYSNMDDFVEPYGDGLRLALSKTTRDQRACIAELTEDTTGGSGDGERKLVVRTKVKLHDKTKNLELLGRHLKLFTDRVEHTGLEGLADRLNQVRNKKHASDGA